MSCVQALGELLGGLTGLLLLDALIALLFTDWHLNSPYIIV